MSKYAFYQAWCEHGQPQLMVYFCQKPYTPKTTDETDQWGQVIAFREQFPKEGLWWPYKYKRDFERLLRRHLTQFLRHRNSPQNPTGSADISPPQDHRQHVIDEIASRLEALNEERLKGIAHAMVHLAQGQETGVTLTSNTETLAAQTAVCMVDHIAVSDVVSHLIRLIRSMKRQDAN